MNTDAATKAWLTGELTSALGFAEVEDIAAYVLSSFSSKQEVAGYLTELLGISPTRAETISARLFAVAPQSRPQQQQANASSGKKHGKSNNAGALGVAASSNAGAGTGLVPQASVPNSRIKAAKPRKTGAPKMMHTHVINCLQCGKIEHNAGRKCAFCGAELRYEELDEHEIDRAAQQHMETLVMYDEASAERTTVIDADEQYYEEVTVGGDGEDDRRPHGAVMLDLDLESRQFVVRGGDRIRRNGLLTKDAREICESVQRRLEKVPVTAGGRKSGTPASAQHGEAPSSVDEGALWLADDSNAPELLFV